MNAKPLFQTLAGASLFTLALVVSCAKPAELTSSPIAQNGADAHSALHIVPSTQDFFSGQNLEFVAQMGGASDKAVYTWDHRLNGAKSCSEVPGDKKFKLVLNCSSEGSLQVGVTVNDSGRIYGPVYFPATLLKNDGSKPVSPGVSPTAGPSAGPTSAPTGAPTAKPSVAPTATATPAAPTPTPDAMTVVFTIQDGTGAKSWNSAATMVEAFVPQNIIIVNKDKSGQKHTLHTNGNKPCPHGVLIPLDGMFTCKAGLPLDPNVDGFAYNHEVGATTPFYLTVYDPKAVYAANCQSCHGAVATSSKRNRTAVKIEDAIATVGAMKNIKLSKTQVQAIAYALNNP